MLAKKNGKIIPLKSLPKRNVTPEQAMRVLRKNGIEVDENQAKKILDFMYIMAKLAIMRHFSSEKQFRL